jgi:hypothetical protein
MTHYSAPLLIAATMYLMTLPAPAVAHGLSSVAATFILSFLALALVAPGASTRCLFGGQVPTIKSVQLRVCSTLP